MRKAFTRVNSFVDKYFYEIAIAIMIFSFAFLFLCKMFSPEKTFGKYEVSQKRFETLEERLIPAAVDVEADKAMMRAAVEEKYIGFFIEDDFIVISGWDDVEYWCTDGYEWIAIPVKNVGYVSSSEYFNVTGKKYPQYATYSFVLPDGYLTMVVHTQFPEDL